MVPYAFIFDVFLGLPQKGKNGNLKGSFCRPSDRPTDKCLSVTILYLRNAYQVEIKTLYWRLQSFEDVKWLYSNVKKIRHKTYISTFSKESKIGYVLLKYNYEVKQVVPPSTISIAKKYLKLYNMLN